MKLFVLVGMIASGKSTYCNNAAKSGQIIINDDGIVTLVHGGDYTLYSEDLKVLYKTIENNILGTALAMGRSVVIDRGVNISIKGRQRWLSLANSLDVPCEAISFHNEGPEVHAERRAKNDGRGHDYDYWLKVAEAHDKVYSFPDFKEGFSAVHLINFDDIQKGVVFS